MLRSMTGFGAASGAAGEREVRVEARSVNHRHLKVDVRLPQELAFLEADVETRVKKRLSRGTVSVYVRASRFPAAAAARLNVDVAERYGREIARLSLELGGDGSVPIGALLPLPGVLEPIEEEAEIRREAKAILGLVDAALAALVEMRAKEGRALAADLSRNAVAVERLVARIERRMPQVVRGHQKALRRRVDDLLEGRTGRKLDPADLAREVALLADRLDVSEEVARLRSHTAQLAALLRKGGDSGRRLDFLVQELLREANTIGSKCSDAKVAHWVVDMKTRIERLREQVQNVE